MRLPLRGRHPVPAARQLQQPWLIGEMTIHPAAIPAAQATAAAPAIAEKIRSPASRRGGAQIVAEGVSASDLWPILAHLNEPRANIGGALGRLKRQGVAEKRGDLWFWIGATPAAKTPAKAAKAANGKVDRSIGGRRNRRQAVAAATGAEAGGEAAPPAGGATSGAQGLERLPPGSSQGGRSGSGPAVRRFRLGTRDRAAGRNRAARDGAAG